MKKNELIYKCSKEVNDTVVYVTIRLNDECNNGHNDFRITGEVYEKGKPKTDKYMIRCGSCHEEILKAFPKFKMFVDLHLCSSDGYPMFLGQNGAYHMRLGEKEKAMANLRCSNDMYKKLYPYHIDNLLFKKAIAENGLLDVWNKQSKEAIAYLEELTGDEFVEDKHVPFFSEDEIRLLESGTITLESVQAKMDKRKGEERIKQVEEIEKKYDEQIASANLEKKVRLLMLDFDGENWIWYTHSNTLCFNWRDYERKVTKEEVEAFMKKHNVIIDFNIEFKK